MPRWRRQQRKRANRRRSRLVRSICAWCAYISRFEEQLLRDALVFGPARANDYLFVSDEEREATLAGMQREMNIVEWRIQGAMSRLAYPMVVHAPA